MIDTGQKGKRYSPRFRLEVVLKVLKEDRDAVEIARAHDLRPTTVARWKREFPENIACVVTGLVLGAGTSNKRS